MRQKIAGALFLLVIVAITLFVAQQIRKSSALQDCVASGRRDCVPVPRGNP